MTGFHGRWVLPSAGVLLALATPAGGASLILGWLFFAYYVWRCE